jgi:hypothetical protein
MDLPSAVDAVMLLLSLLLLASFHAVASFTCKHPCFWWSPYCVGGHVVALIPAVACFSAVVSSHRTIGLWLLDCNFFLLSNYRNIEYRIGQLKKVSDYQISDQGLNLSDYWISDSENTSGCPPIQQA